MKSSGMLLCAALIGLSQAPRAALAQDEAARIRELERKLEQSLQRIDELSTRVNQLGTGAPGAPAPAAQPAVALPAMSANSVDAYSAGVPFHGFGHVGGGFIKGDGGGFDTGALDIYLTPQFNDRVRALFEVFIEFGEDGSPGLDLERSQIGYAFSDAVTLWLGRFHTPYGYYNTAFHHGQLVQTSILKPKFLDFEDAGGVMPSHTVGTWATGRFSLGSSRFTYDAYVGNSPSILENTLDMNNLGSRNHSASVGLNLGYVGAGGNLKLGGHYYRARVADDSDPVNETRMSFVGPYAVFDNGAWEAYFEYYRYNDDNLASNTGAPTGEHRSYAWFAQLGRRFQAWTPYARYEKASFSEEDNYFALQTSGRSYTRWLGGLRYDINPRAAVTAELNRTKQDDPALLDYNEFRFQYAIGF